MRQRDPPIFSGTEDHDVEDWLADYDRVSIHNHWDDTKKLNYVSFYLSGVANVWHRNHERDLTTWAAFKTNVTEVFGRPAVRELRAEQRLRSRAQQCGETFTSYIEDVVDLCNRVDVTMADAEKIRHILKGIEDDAFHMLLAKNPATVSELVSLCQSFDEFRKQRIATRQSPPQATSMSSLAVSPDNTSLLLQIKEFVREEVARQLSLISRTHGQSNSPLAPALRFVIKEQVADHIPPSLQQAPVAAPLTYTEVPSRPAPQTYGPLRPAFAPARIRSSRATGAVCTTSRSLAHGRQSPDLFLLWPCWTRSTSLSPPYTERPQQCAPICATFPTTPQLFGHL
ncbi:uncharacterized protein [Dermacentor albipictus]|uniref:uncharacterized protein n=1 Tax=Dermacentor albipictus TaxID=60249 RepID=UPI0038FC87F3